jgi:hypothetical protein
MGEAYRVENNMVKKPRGGGRHNNVICKPPALLPTVPNDERIATQGTIP